MLGVVKLPAAPPSEDLILNDPDRLVAAVRSVNVATDPYLPWDQLRFRPAPSGLTPAQWWAATSILRRAQSRPLPLKDLAGHPFRYALPDEVLRLADKVSVRAGGNIDIAEPVTDPATRDTYVVRSLMEESITSSQLEGAATTRQVAKAMLRSGRDPRDKGERMIWNNYHAMHFVRDHRNDPLTPELVLELHEIVTSGTLDDPADGGRLQGPKDQRVRVVSSEGDILHTPPPAAELDDRLVSLCAFANAPDETGTWLHPVLRAIAVHFMVGHDHYFVDGNGRLARALFYWCMLQRGLWLTEFVTISAILRQAPVQYANAYLHTEAESDLTYFLIHQLRVIDRALDDLEAYLAHKVQERHSLRVLLAGRTKDFNHRQLALLNLSLTDPSAEFTAVSHASSHDVTGETARNDLLDLEQRGVLVRSKRGRQHVWRPAPDIQLVLGRR